MQLPRNAAQRRFLAVWTVSTLVKVAAFAVFVLWLFTLPGVPKP